MSSNIQARATAKGGFRPEWVEYAESLSYSSQYIAFYKAVAFYAVQREEPQRLTGDALDYFNRNVRPVLDRRASATRKGEGRP